MPFAKIVEHISPSIVSIASSSLTFDTPEARLNRHLGSGIVIDSRGHIFTSAHLVTGKQAIEVMLQEGVLMEATLVGVDAPSDLALLKIAVPANQPLPALPLRENIQIQVGEEVLAIGSPMGFQQTVSHGIVSAVDRYVSSAEPRESPPLIQTDAAVNPGSSGGPLVNRCGEVIGLVTGLLSEAKGIAFAVPVSVLTTVMPSLLKEGRVSRPWLGFYGQFINAAFIQLFRIPLVEGLLIEAVVEGGPAEGAGLEGGALEVILDGHAYYLGGDIVTRINDKPVTTPQQFDAIFHKLKVGDQIALTLMRNGERKTVRYTLPEVPTWASSARSSSATSFSPPTFRQPPTHRH